jgi:DNA-binding YbaB/EbfC family protein
MLKGLGELGNLMKLQKEMKEIQKSLKKTFVEGFCSDETVKTVVNGEFEFQSIFIDPKLLVDGNSKKLEKLVLFAINDAVDRMKRKSSEEMSKFTNGMNIPGM